MYTALALNFFVLEHIRVIVAVDCFYVKRRCFGCRRDAKHSVTSRVTWQWLD